jgi:hypothetical protein
MLSRLSLSAGLFFICVTAMSQEPKSEQEALALIAKIEGTVKFDESKHAIDINI